MWKQVKQPKCVEWLRDKPASAHHSYLLLSVCSLQATPQPIICLQLTSSALTPPAFTSSRTVLVNLPPELLSASSNLDILPARTTLWFHLPGNIYRAPSSPRLRARPLGHCPREAGPPSLLPLAPSPVCVPLVHWSLLQGGMLSLNK